MRTGFGTNNLDHCTRLCHASSVAALLEGIGSGAVSAPFGAVKDAGLIPMMYPNYQPVESPEVRRRFEEVWGRPLDPNKGPTVVETMDAIHEGKVKGMYIMGENPAMSDPNIQHARDALAKLDPFGKIPELKFCAARVEAL